MHCKLKVLTTMNLEKYPGTFHLYKVVDGRKKVFFLSTQPPPHMSG